jgi:hypothetical protein
MRLYNQPHRFYAGIDLHARSMFTHVLNEKGKTVFEHDLPARPDDRVCTNGADAARASRSEPTEVSIPPGASPSRCRHPAGVEFAVLPGRWVGTERFLRRHCRRVAAAFSEEERAGPRKAVWCRSAVPRRTLPA